MIKLISEVMRGGERNPWWWQCLAWTGLDRTGLLTCAGGGGGWDGDWAARDWGDGWVGGSGEARAQTCAATTTITATAGVTAQLPNSNR